MEMRTSDIRRCLNISFISAAREPLVDWLTLRMCSTYESDESKPTEPNLTVNFFTVRGARELLFDCQF